MEGSCFLATGMARNREWGSQLAVPLRVSAGGAKSQSSQCVFRGGCEEERF